MAAMAISAEPRTATRLLERTIELATLGELLDAAIDGAGGVAVLIGSPGIGKTAVLDAVTGSAPQVTRVLRARGDELEREFPYGIMQQLLEPVLRACSAAARDELLAGAAAPLRPLLLGGAGMPADGGALDHAFYWALANLADDAPLLLAIDDAHWADSASLRTLVHVARRVADLKLAVIVASRPPAYGDQQALLERLIAAGPVLGLDGLSADGTSALVRERLPAADDAFCRACASATGGNPFLLIALLSAARASGLEPVAANIARVHTIGPEVIARSVLLRLRTLPELATPVARALAVLGDRARADLAGELVAADERAVASALDGLARIEVLAAELPPRFVHSIVRGAVYEDIPAAERSRLHRHAARLLAAEGASPDAVGSQLLATEPGADPWVAEQLISAAGGRAANSAPEAVVAYMERALAEAVPGVDRRRMLLMLGFARLQIGQGRPVPPLREALRLTKTDPQLQVEAVQGLGSALIAEQSFEESWALVDEWIERLHPHPQQSLDLEVCAAHRVYADPEGAAGQLDRVRRWRPDPRGATALDRSQLALQAWVAMIEPRVASEVAALARAALSSGSLVIDGPWYVTYEMAIWALLAAGEHERARTDLDATIELVLEAGRLARASSIRPLRGELHRRCGRLALAVEDTRIAFETIPADHVGGPFSAALHALALVDQGDLAAARAALRCRRLDCGEIPPAAVGDIAWLVRGRLLVAEGQLEAGVAEVLRFGEISERACRHNPGLWPWRSIAADGLVRLGRADQAKELAAEELELARDTHRRDLQAAPLRLLGLARGGDDGLELLDRSLLALDGSDLALERISSLIELGAALRRGGQRERAREPLGRALEAATTAGAALLAVRAREELLASGARPRRTALQGIEALTPSEKRVASLAADGKTNREIAQILFVTTKTVEAHLRRSYDKLGVAGKSELAAALS
jgi:DNA-binding CsgD family transcriptional regulator